MSLTHNVVLPTVYGQMIVNRRDINQTLSFLQTGKAIDHAEIENIAQFIELNSAAVDIGTCFGAWTLAFSARAAQVYSFEAQRHIYNCLCGSLALNSIANVLPFNIALGNTNGFVKVPRYSADEIMQYGSVCLRSNITQEGMPIPVSTEQAPLRTLDSFELTNVSLIKVDAEGMDLDVLFGAEDTIHRNRPVIYVEIGMLGREEFEKFFTNMEYVFSDNDANMLAVPSEKFEKSILADGVTNVIKRREIPNSQSSL